MTTTDPWFEHDPDEEVPGSPMARTLLTVAGTVAAVALLAGVVIGASLLLRGERTEATTVEVDPNAPVRLVPEGVDLRIVPIDGQQLEIDATVVEGLLSTSFSVAREDLDVVIAAECRTWLVPGCGAAVTVGVPRGFTVQVLGGDGDVTVEDLEVLELDVTTTSGDIDLAFAQQPFGIKARSSSGDISIVVPDGEVGYNTTVSSDSGDVRDEVSEDEEPSGGFLTVQTVSGDVVIRRP